MADITRRLPTRLRLAMQLLCGIACSSFSLSTFEGSCSILLEAAMMMMALMLISNHDDDGTDVNLD